MSDGASEILVGRDVFFAVLVQFGEDRLSDLSVTRIVQFSEHSFEQIVFASAKV